VKHLLPEMAKDIDKEFVSWFQRQRAILGRVIATVVAIPKSQTVLTRSSFTNLNDRQLETRIIIVDRV